MCTASQHKEPGKKMHSISGIMQQRGLAKQAARIAQPAPTQLCCNLSLAVRLSKHCPLPTSLPAPALRCTMPAHALRNEPAHLPHLATPACPLSPPMCLVQIRGISRKGKEFFKFNTQVRSLHHLGQGEQLGLTTPPGQDDSCEAATKPFSASPGPGWQHIGASIKSSLLTGHHPLTT